MLVVKSVAVAFTVRRRVFPAHKRPVFINAALMVFSKEQTLIAHIKEPFPFFHKNGYCLVSKIPSYFFEVIFSSRRVYLKSEIPAALGGTLPAMPRGFSSNIPVFFHHINASARLALPSARSFLFAEGLCDSPWQDNRYAAVYGSSPRKARR